MSYLMQSRLVEDEVLIQRLAACAAAEGVANPMGFITERMWALSTQPGWAAAYASSSEQVPGADETAITDEMISEVVQSTVTTALEDARRRDASAAELAALTGGAVPPSIALPDSEVPA